MELVESLTSHGIVSNADSFRLLFSVSIHVVLGPNSSRHVIIINAESLFLCIPLTW
jgi:hypothetical protein